MGRLGTVCPVVLIVLGVALVGVGLALIFVFPEIIKNNLEAQVALKAGSESYKNWEKPPAPIYIHFWFFNVVNPDDIVAGKKPIVKEMGPYTYREIKNKENVTFHEDGSKIRYTQPKYYVFEREMSNGTENDTFMGVNFPILTVATMLNRTHPGWNRFARLVLNTEALFKNYTVEQYLWGFQDPIIAFINKLLKMIGLKPLEDTFGLFYGPTGNGTSDGVYEIYSGTSDINKMSLIDTWNNQTTLPYWKDKYCNTINGSDGQSWHPYMRKNETLYLFSSDVCRSLYVTYQKPVDLEGIHLYRYTCPPSVLADHETNPDNACYCTNTTGCLGAGVIDISACKQGAPIILSLPHFYQGAEKYVNAVDGLHPSQELHETRIDVEPYTGAVLHAAKKLQFNFYLQPLDTWSKTANMNITVFPCLWLNESGGITPELAKEFKNKVYWPIEMTSIVQYGMIGLGGLVLLATAVFLGVTCAKRRNNGSPLLVPIDDDERGILDDDHSLNT